MQQGGGQGRLFVGQRAGWCAQGGSGNACKAACACLFCAVCKPGTVLVPASAIAKQHLPQAAVWRRSGRWVCVGVCAPDASCKCPLPQACTRSRRRCWTCWCCPGQTSLWAPSAGQLCGAKACAAVWQDVGPAAAAGGCTGATSRSCWLLHHPAHPAGLPPVCRSAFSYMARELRQLGGKSTASTRLHPVETLQYDVVLEISRES